jgi:hypothetical protein
VADRRVRLACETAPSRAADADLVLSDDAGIGHEDTRKNDRSGRELPDNLEREGP